MLRDSTTGLSASAAFMFFASASLAHAVSVPVNNWIVHNGTATVGGTPTAPILTPGDNIVLMASFSDVVLANDGDYVEATTTLTIDSRSTTGFGTLNSQLRFGIFDNSVSESVAGNDAPNIGFMIQHTDAPPGMPTEEQQSLTQTNPFMDATRISYGQRISVASIDDVSPSPVVFTLRLTREGGTIHLYGKINGPSRPNPFSTQPYFSVHEILGYSSTNFPANGSFNFNRIGLFLGEIVDATSASLADSFVTTNVVPEPASIGICLVGLSLSACRRHTRPTLSISTISRGYPSSVSPAARF